ncbi:sensor histidine kinase [Paenibacillus paridis]|uniref:sensor histidine kinase n=1 Tax=Paenibacillus paridis TaxID=2583376 RepID=UPI00111FE3D0|nr:sensor histidine kinase [Paenibacillus paridis]
MFILLLVVIGILLAIIVFQYLASRTRSGNIQQLQGKLKQVMEDRTGESLLLFTDDRELQSLLVEINQLLDYARKRAAAYEKTEMATKKMISNVSHDLRTPLTVILGYIETIHLDPLMSSREREELLAKVYKKTLELLELIHKFFDLSKLESGDEQMPIERVHINEVCRQNILAFYEILTNKGFDVRIAIPDEAIFVLGNEAALNRMLNNLLSNAIQHGGDGKVIGLTLRTEKEFALIEILDHGKGISEQHQDRVFERLYTLEDSRNPASPSSGLGLAITKRLARAIGGTVTLFSKPHEQTVFSIRLKRIQY